MRCTLFGVLPFFIALCWGRHRFYADPHSFLYSSITAKAIPAFPSLSSTAVISNGNAGNNGNRNTNVLSGVPILYITDFGGDPHGIGDSTTAFMDAINTALTSYGAPNATYPYGVKDLGGVTISLGGGDYKISKPLLIPSNYGNLRIVDGTIRASTAFAPTSHFLLTIGDNTNAGDCAGNECNQNIAIENMALDCRHICAGGISLYYAQMVSIGPSIFITAFNEAGIRVFASGGTMISNAYLAEYFTHDSDKSKAKATAIEYFTHDSYITNVVVFNAAIGIHINGSANVLAGIHIWGLTANTQVTTLSDQIGILADGYCHDVRIVNCYFDWNHLVVVGSVFELSVENTFFLGGGSVIFKADSPHTCIRSFNFVDSMFTIGPYKGNASTILVDESDGNEYTVVSNVVMNGMQLNGNWGATFKYHLRTTATQKQLTQTNASKWVFDFNDVLVFGHHIGIASLQYTLRIQQTSANQFVQHYAMIDEATDNRTVTIYTDKPCDATVYIHVDQSTYNPELK